MKNAFCCITGNSFCLCCETMLRIDGLQALDYVIAEARRNGIRLLLSLVNNLQAYGGKTQYVKWAWQEGVGLSSSNDSFFFDPTIRSYFKNYIKVWHIYLSILFLFSLLPPPLPFWLYRHSCMAFTVNFIFKKIKNSNMIFFFSLTDPEMYTVITKYYCPQHLFVLTNAFIWHLATLVIIRDDWYVSYDA